MAYFIEDTLVLYANVMFFYKKDDNNHYKLRNRKYVVRRAFICEYSMR